MSKSPSAKRSPPTVVADSSVHLNAQIPPESAPLATTSPQTEAPRSEPRQQTQLWESQLALVREMCCKPKNRAATDAEFTLFLHQCRTRRLDPLARQIYCVFRNSKEGNNWVEKMTIQTSIDGFRLIAQRTGEYRGQCGPWWCGEGGEWVDVWTAKTPPTAAKVGVFREGFKEPLFAVARFDSYAQYGKSSEGGREYLTGQWGKMADLMIAKCAEALGLRRAFPDELSGIYTSDEMSQADNGHEDTPAAPTLPAPTKPQDAPAHAPTPNHQPTPPASVKGRLWGAISVWTGVAISDQTKLIAAGKHIYAYHKTTANATATEEQLAKILKWVTEQQQRKVQFGAWLGDRLERIEAEKALASKTEPTLVREPGDIADEDIPFAPQHHFT